MGLASQFQKLPRDRAGAGQAQFLGGLGEFCVRPSPLAAQFGFEEIPPLMEMAYEAFGPRRMMWGSDYPPVGGREGYHNSLQAVIEHPVFKSQEDKDWAFGDTALEVFKLT